MPAPLSNQDHTCGSSTLPTLDGIVAKLEPSYSGTLQLSSSRPYGNCTMYGDGEEHVQQCSFYHTKWNVKWTDDQDIAKQLVKLNHECYERFEMPIL